MTDRFFDGNSLNNDPLESVGLFDTKFENWKMYWGGDFEGIRQKLPYLKELGITALWISPPYDNINKKVVYNDVPNTAYHGYWAKDFKRPEEHFGTWDDFDALVRDAHSLDLKIIIDWAPNHTSPADPLDASFAERGVLFDNGRFVGDYVNDTCRLFHHNGGIVDWDDRYESKYMNIADLADLDQTNEEVHRLLRESLDVWLQHDIDGIRLDAIKHMTRGWQTSFADQVNSSPTPMFIFGEWYMGNFDNPLLNEALRFSNQSGISQLDFLLNRALRDVFIYNHSFHELNSVINRLSKDYEHAGHNMVTFIDNHDMARFLTENNDRQALHQALVFLFTQRGTPCVYYGLEQYLHEDMNGGSDPWNRPMMPRNGFDRQSEAFQLIKRLSQLKQTLPALKWGDYRARYVSDDVLVYERQFG
ncbi:unnamed protein product [Rotaria sordida]|uniref:Alpha-amylase n=3 Tax=Rotaria sordida TaxID=392033 RepID=A0A815MEH5_9BILA|nr:unnamed protein product [Rotaria sordida]